MSLNIGSCFSEISNKTKKEAKHLKHHIQYFKEIDQVHASMCVKKNSTLKLVKYIYNEISVMYLTIQVIICWTQSSRIQCSSITQLQVATETQLG